MDLVQKLKEEFVSTRRLPLTPEGMRNMPCHPVEEMDIEQLEKIMISDEKGFIQAQSEDEVCDLIAYMETRPIAKEFYLDLEFPAMLGKEDYGQGPYLFAYARKDLIK